MENYDELKRLTEQLLNVANEANDKLSKVKADDGYVADFFGEVKPFADQVKLTTIKWNELALQWINKEHPKQIYPLQISSVCENLEQLSIQAFFKDTKVKRFKEMYHAVQFLLGNMLDQLNK